MLTLIVLLLFPYLFWTAWKNIRLARESAAWPGVPGTVTASERTKVAWRTQPRVTYSYQVEGKDYSGNTLLIGGAVAPKETESTLSRYPVGAAVMVHYSPRDAAVAVLEPGPNRYVSAVLRAYILWFAVIVGGQVLLLAVNRWVATHSEPETAMRTYGDGKPGDGPAPDDIATGDRLIREAADKGDAKDEGYVGAWYLGGLEGYPKDPVEAAKWFRKSAEQGDAGSQSLLGELYVQGKGVPRDLPQAIQWLQKAADQGDPHGCVGIGMAYEKGAGGLPRDKQKAIEWYRKAGADPQAKQCLARLGAN